MDRRHVLAALAATAAAGPALAQGGSSGSMQSGSSSGTMSGMASGQGSGAMMPMGQAEQQYMQRTLMIGTVSLETSKLAQEKARNDDVQQFAKFEAEEAQTVAEILRSMGDPSSTASTQAQPQGEMAQMAEKLRGMQAGAEFDRMYVTGQLQAHQELLKVQEEYIRGGQNMHVKHIAMLAAGRIREHIADLQDLQKRKG
jgi:putative membrane protein